MQYMLLIYSDPAAMQAMDQEKKLARWRPHSTPIRKL